MQRVLLLLLTWQSNDRCSSDHWAEVSWHIDDSKLQGSRRVATASFLASFSLLMRLFEQLLLPSDVRVITTLIMTEIADLYCRLRAAMMGQDLSEMLKTSLFPFCSSQ